MAMTRIPRRMFLARSSQVLGALAVSPFLAAANSAAPDNSLTELTASAAVDAMRQGDIKAEDYASALLGRARRFENLNAFRTLDPDQVLEAARGADRARASGSPLGILHGLPIPVKDSINTKALPTSNGTRALRDFRPKDDAAVLKPLMSQGGIVMGKTNLHELSYGWTSNNGTFGPVRNPYNLAHIPGGSSGGSAAAVAARIAPLAIAEDTVGSIRVPAACCGLAGFRPTFGRYPDHGIMPLTQNKFDQVGPVARTTLDLVLFDRAVTGDTRPVTATPLKGIRIGVSPAFHLAGLEPQVERVTKDALQRLREAGAVIVEAEVPEVVKSAFDIAFAVATYESVPCIRDFLAQEQTHLTFEQLFSQVSESLQGVFKSVAIAPNRPTKETYEALLAKRGQLKQAVRHYFQEQGIVALAFPTSLIAPPKIGDETEFEIGGQKVSLGVAMARNVALGSCASMASLVLPAGLTANGLPVGLEFDALPGEDRNLLSLGLSLEKALGSIPGPKI